MAGFAYIRIALVLQNTEARITWIHTSKGTFPSASIKRVGSPLADCGVHVPLGASSFLRKLPALCSLDVPFLMLRNVYGAVSLRTCTAVLW